jgi:ubiquinone/menaquinone biosynthesis C-methylase UbiE
MNRMQPTSPAQAYEDYFVPAIFARWAPILIGSAKPVQGERVLDVACGTGVMARTVAPLVGREGRVVGLDISPEMLGVAAKVSAPEGAAIEWLQGDAESLPEGPFDLILCQQGLQFFPSRENAVRAMRDALDEGGRAVVSVWRGLEMQPLYEALFQAEARYLGVPLAEVARPFTFDATHQLEGLFRDAGFTRVEVRDEAREVSFPSPDGFVALTVLAGAAVLPELAELQEAERAGLISAVSAEVAPTIERFIRDGGVTFPMLSQIAVAHR